MCLCGRTGVDAQAVSFSRPYARHARARWASKAPILVPSTFVVSARGMKALLALRKGLVNHLAHIQETVSIGPSTEKALLSVAFGDMDCS